MSARHFEHSDADWIALIRRRDTQAISDVSQICMRACIWHFRDWTEIDPRDAVMDALIKLIVAVDRPDFRIRSSFEGYAYQTASRHCFDIKRRIRRERELFQATPPEALAQIPQHAPEDEPDATQRAALYQALRDCIARLPLDDQRLIIWSGERVGPSAIALELGPPATANNIGVRLHRIRKSIKGCMEAGGLSAAFGL